MEDIIIKKTGNVYVRVEVTGMVTWICEYYDTKKHSTKKTEIKSSNNNVDIGNPDDLNGNTDSWSVRITKAGSAKQKYTVKIDWLQNGTVVHTWSPGDNLEISGDFVPHDESGDITLET
jgi:hypothetical protein